MPVPYHVQAPAPWRRWLWRSGTRLAWTVAIVALLLLAVVLATAFAARSLPPLQAWHRIELPEPDAAALRTMDWDAYLRAEQALFERKAREMAATARPGRYRYDLGSALGAPPGTRDWNRSYASTPREPRGGVLLLHGLSDSPYSLHHLVALYEAQGYAVVLPRMPGHGTVPSGLRHAQWMDWLAATELGARELRRRIGDERPLHIVGYSNGGALALKYTMDRLDLGGQDPALPMPDRLVLVSPMIGVGRMAAFSRLMPVLGWIPYFEKSRWLDVQPEFNPFKYNSFPVNAVQQSWLLTGAVKSQLLALQASGRSQRMPPVLSFQSVLDSTVSTPDVVRALYDRLPANGSELVLFDINRQSLLAPMFTAGANELLGTLEPGDAHDYRLTVLRNRDAGTLSLAESRLEPGATAPSSRPLDLAWPADVYSLSHVALPFPTDDPLYGLQPRAVPDYGIRLGTLSLHGERGALSVSAEQWQRIGSNPFFSYLEGRVGEVVVADAQRAPK
ncbi:alpha/beta hydrolase [Arenimonas sp. MALMAid1274]|uniref:alpha/beta hydrolase n=1 Tax=Arenimonas sp. MALMAid1274 TaxID=3411630 RepID=UPI003BA1DDE2